MKKIDKKVVYVSILILSVILVFLFVIFFFENKNFDKSNDKGNNNVSDRIDNNPEENDDNDNVENDDKTDEDVIDGTITDYIDYDNLELIGDEKEEMIISSELSNGIISKDSNYNLGELVIGNVSSGLIEGVYGCVVKAEVKNVSQSDIENVKIKITFYDVENNLLDSIEQTVSLKVGETDLIQEFYFDEEHNELLNFVNYQVVII